MLAILNDLAIGLVTNLAWDRKIKRDDKYIIEQIKLRISDFNRRYDNTELDTRSFESFLKSSDIVEMILI